MMRWRRSVAYIGIAMASWALTSYAYYHLLEMVRPSRQMTFFVSMGAVLVVMFGGLALEDKLIWKRFFDGRYKRYDTATGVRRTAPPPLTVGVMSGLLIFFFWR
jgi:hypothetical protein